MLNHNKKTSQSSGRPELEEYEAKYQIGPDKITQKKVRRRVRAAVIDKMDTCRQEAAAVYAALYEVVHAGGGGGGDVAPDIIDGGKTVTEGRQSGVVSKACKLREMDVAIGGGVIQLNKHVTVSIRTLVIMAAVFDMGIPSMLDRLDVRRTSHRTWMIKEAIEVGLSRVGGVLGYEKPLKK